MTADIASRTFAIEAGEIAAVDDWIETIGGRWALPRQTVLRARLCIAELATNLLEHAAPRASDRVSVTLRQLDDGIGVDMVDSCAPFDLRQVPETLEASSIEQALPGGRGVRLVRAFARSLSYRSSDGRNHVSFEIAAA